MADILVVDDERSMRQYVKSILLAEGFSVRLARDGSEALSLFRERRPDLVLLDIMMPGRNGFSVCEDIRRIDSLTPVLFLTAKTDEVDQVRGFGLGADDYVFKSLGDASLVARIKRAIERSSSYCEISEKSRRQTMGSATIDFDSQLVTSAEGSVRLTKTEADLLWLLFNYRGALVPYDEIIEVLTAGGFTGDLGAIHTYMSRLKKKLGKSSSLLRAERGVGYILMR